MKVPTWRIWLVTGIAAAWGILGISAAARGAWLIVAIAAVMFTWNAYQLWVFTRNRD